MRQAATAIIGKQADFILGSPRCLRRKRETPR
jgi:hypothetical protein